MEVLGATWQRKFEVACCLITNRGTLQKALKGPFLILRNQCRLHRNQGASRGSRGTVVLVIYRSWQMPVIGLGRRLVYPRLRS